jgi:hypothetical protein
LYTKSSLRGGVSPLLRIGASLTLLMNLKSCPNSLEEILPKLPSISRRNNPDVDVTMRFDSKCPLPGRFERSGFIAIAVKDT